MRERTHSWTRCCMLRMDLREKSGVVTSLRFFALSYSHMLKVDSLFERRCLYKSGFLLHLFFAL